MINTIWERIPVTSCVPVALFFVFYSVFLNAGKGRLAKEGSLAPRTREKFSEIFRGVTVSIDKLEPFLCQISISINFVYDLYSCT